MNPLKNLVEQQIKARNIFKQVGKVDIPLKNIEEALEFYESMEFWLDAGSLAERAKMPKKAIINYKNAGNFARAYKVASEFGLKEDAQKLGLIVDKQIRSLEEQQKYFDAAAFAEEAGITERAINNYERSGFQKNADILKEQSRNK